MYLQTTLHGPDAARIMRDELGFCGPIIGYPTLTNCHPQPPALKSSNTSLLLSFLLLINEGVTGNALAQDMEAFISKGADQVITKPLTKTKLMNVLQPYVSATGIKCGDKWGDNNRMKGKSPKRLLYYCRIYLMLHYY